MKRSFEDSKLACITDDTLQSSLDASLQLGRLSLTYVQGVTSPETVLQPRFPGQRAGAYLISLHPAYAP
jgi:hypothetical protein